MAMVLGGKWRIGGCDVCYCCCCCCSDVMVLLVVVVVVGRRKRACCYSRQGVGVLFFLALLPRSKTREAAWAARLGGKGGLEQDVVAMVVACVCAAFASAAAVVAFSIFDAVSPGCPDDVMMLLPWL